MSYVDKNLAESNLSQQTGYSVKNTLKDDFIVYDDINAIKSTNEYEKSRLLEKTLIGKDQEISALNDRNKILGARLKFDFSEYNNTKPGDYGKVNIEWQIAEQQFGKTILKQEIIISKLKTQVKQA